MATTDQVRALVEPLAEAAGAHVYDVTFTGGKLVVALSRPGGIDLETLTEVSRRLNVALDEHDVVPGSYTLEVTSPGLERTLRTAGHFAAAIGDEVTVRTKPDVEGERRVRGTVRRVDDDDVTIALEDGTERTLDVADIERARTVFTWGGADKPGGGKATSGQSKQPKKRARS
jgi:ribosome maturation factor RimP